jgi:glycosyltransferase involved in cell wall biosynthesis
MKVLLVSEYFPPKVFGGGEISAEFLAKNLTEKKIEVFVLTSYFKGLKKYQEKDNYNVYRLLETGDSPYSLFSNIKRLYNFPVSVRNHVELLDNKLNFDIIHCLNSTSIEGVAYSNLNKRKVATLNSYVSLCPKANLFYKEESSCKGCEPLKFLKCILNSEYVAKQRLKSYLKYNPLFLGYIYGNYLKNIKLLKNFNLLCRSNFILDFVKNKKITKKKIAIEYNTLEINKKELKYKKLEKKIQNKILITYIGSLEKIKGVDLLIKAYKKVQEKNHSLLLIVGDGYEKNNLIELSKKIGIKQKIIFTGNLDYKYIPYIYKKSDVIALITKWPEPFSRVLLEATYYGKPIIATKTGGNPDAIINDKNGFLVNKNINEISEKIEYLINNKKKRESMGKESKKIYNEKFNKDKTINNIIEFYKNL